MDRNHRYCVIMAGANGNSLWPLSRESKPKQFIDYKRNGVSPLRGAYLRSQGIVPDGNILVITAERYASLVRECLPELPEENLLLEPYARKTGTCIVFSTYEILRRDPDAVITVTPSDIIIHDTVNYRIQVGKALDYVSVNPVLMTLGVPPSSPDTTFGYIQAMGGRDALKEEEPVKVKTFTEKPPRELAQIFCLSGEFLWNSGIFAWKGSVIREEMERYMPEVTDLFKDWQLALGSPARGEFLRRAYTDVHAISIDNAVLEKTDRAWVKKADFDWCDLSSLMTLDKYILEKDERQNSTNLPHTCFQDSRDCTILGVDKTKMVAVKGLDGYIVVDTGDVIMICPKNETLHKEIIGDLTKANLEKFR